jgi:hypothetical protein
VTPTGGVCHDWRRALASLPRRVFLERVLQSANTLAVAAWALECLATRATTDAIDESWQAKLSVMPSLEVPFSGTVSESCMGARELLGSCEPNLNTRNDTG